MAYPRVRKAFIIHTLFILLKHKLLHPTRRMTLKELDALCGIEPPTL